MLFQSKNGNQIKILEITNLKDKTAYILTNYIIEFLNKDKLSDTIIAYYGDNCNINFEGSNRKRTKNVFLFLNNSLKNNICGIAAHVLHNAVQSSSNIFPIDVESIANKAN